jgi:thiol-disulfide isomerase/thioredoxin
MVSRFAPSLRPVVVASVLAVSGCSDPIAARSASPAVPIPVLDAGGVCVGVRPPAEAWRASPGPERFDGGTDSGAGPLAEPADAGADAALLEAGADGSELDPRTVGAPMPRYALEDMQPLSCGFGATYGLPVFEGKVTAVVLLAGWCGFCQAQALKLEQMRVELAKESKDFQIVIVNKGDAVEQVSELTRRTSVPVLQDLPIVDAWNLHAGFKDDFYVYGRDGRLADYLYFGGPRDINLSTEAGYATVKEAFRAVLAKR